MFLVQADSPLIIPHLHQPSSCCLSPPLLWRRPGPSFENTKSSIETLPTERAGRARAAEVLPEPHSGDLCCSHLGVLCGPLKFLQTSASALPDCPWKKWTIIIIPTTYWPLVSWGLPCHWTTFVELLLFARQRVHALCVFSPSDNTVI